jgi:hypothetical protein
LLVVTGDLGLEEARSLVLMAEMEPAAVLVGIHCSTQLLVQEVLVLTEETEALQPYIAMELQPHGQPPVVAVVSEVLEQMVISVTPMVGVLSMEATAVLRHTLRSILRAPLSLMEGVLVVSGVLFRMGLT